MMSFKEKVKKYRLHDWQYFGGFLLIVFYLFFPRHLFYYEANSSSYGLSIIGLLATALLAIPALFSSIVMISTGDLFEIPQKYFSKITRFRLDILKRNEWFVQTENFNVYCRAMERYDIFSKAAVWMPKAMLFVWFFALFLFLLMIEISTSDDQVWFGLFLFVILLIVYGILCMLINFFNELLSNGVPKINLPTEKELCQPFYNKDRSIFQDESISWLNNAFLTISSTAPYSPVICYTPCWISLQSLIPFYNYKIKWGCVDANGVPLVFGRSEVEELVEKSVSKPTPQLLITEQDIQYPITIEMSISPTSEPYINLKRCNTYTVKIEKTVFEDNIEKKKEIFHVLFDSCTGTYSAEP